MDNIVSLDTDRPRPPRALGVPRSGARILFFTGVRYCRDDAHTPYQVSYDLRASDGAASSQGVLDATAH